MENNMTYTQLTLVPENELTQPQKTFLLVHNEMLAAARKAAECLILLATDLKRMRDEELYKEAGFETFKDYVENALKIKERQAYNWISVLELPTDYLELNAGMGVTKLALIAAASHPVQEELMQDDTVGEKSVRELNAEIKRLEAENADKTAQLDIFAHDCERLEAEASAETERANTQSEIAAEYMTRATEAENREKQAIADAEAARAKITELEKELSETKKKKTKTVEKTVEVEKTVDNPETVKALEEAKKALQEAEEKAAQANADKQKAVDELRRSKDTAAAVAAFKAYFGMLNDNLNQCLDSIATIKASDEKLADKCLDKLRVICQNIENEINRG